jgi:hypothetical protein
VIRTVACLIAAALLAVPALADDEADLKATPYFKSCDAADFAEDQCLCFAKALSHGGQNVDPVLLDALEEDFTLQNKGQATLPAVHAALGHRNPPISASDDKINEALVVLVKATHKCASSGG